MFERPQNTPIADGAPLEDQYEFVPIEKPKPANVQRQQVEETKEVSGGAYDYLFEDSIQLADTPIDSDTPQPRVHFIDVNKDDTAQAMPRQPKYKRRKRMNITMEQERYKKLKHISEMTQLTMSEMIETAVYRVYGI